MKIYPKYLCFSFTVILLLVFSIHLSAQTSYLVIEKPGTVKNYKYIPGNEITMKAVYRGMESFLQGRITALTDSTVTINDKQIVRIEDITTLIRTRSIMGLLTDVSWKAGAGFFILDLVNGVLTKREPLIQQGALIISGSLIGISLAAFPFIYKTMDIDGEHWRIKMLINNETDY